MGLSHQGEPWQDPCRDEAILNWWNHFKARKKRIECCFFTVSEWSSLVDHDAKTILSSEKKERDRVRERSVGNGRVGRVMQTYFCPSCISECICTCTICHVSAVICKMLFTWKPYAIFTLDLFPIAIDPNTESVEDLMQRFQDSFRVPNTPTDISHYQHVMHSSLTGRRRVPSHTRGRTKINFSLLSCCFCQEPTRLTFCPVLQLCVSCISS